MSKTLLILTVALLTSTSALAANFSVSSDCIARLAKGENRLKVELPVTALKRLAKGMKDKSLSLQEDAVALLVDYTRNSKVKRAYMVDFKACDVLTEDYAIHGGAYRDGKTRIDGDPNADGMLDSCKNRKGTNKNMTRPGLYVTKGCHDSAKNWTTIQGECNGIKLVGLEKRNVDAFNAGVVLHELTEIKKDGSVKVMGQGCPAFAPGRLKNLVQYGLMTDTLVYVYAPQCE